MFTSYNEIALKVQNPRHVCSKVFDGGSEFDGDWRFALAWESCVTWESSWED